MITAIRNAFRAMHAGSGGGHLLVSRVWGIPLLVHWTAPLGALFIGGPAFRPATWASFVALIVIHELGHAAVVRHCRKQVLRINLNALGGVCWWRGEATEAQRVFIAWGGVLAQLALLIAAVVFVATAGRATTAWGAEIERVAIGVNIFVAAFNLVPVPPLDGATAWRVVPLLRTALVRRWRNARAARAAQRVVDVRAREARQTLAEIERLDDVDDVGGAGSAALDAIVADVRRARSPRRKEPDELV